MPSAVTSLDTLAQRYLELALYLGDHIPGLVDCYFGPAREHPPAATPPPEELLARATSLCEELAGSAPHDERAQYLEAQTAALQCVAERLAGHQMSVVEEVERCYGVTPQLGSLDAYADTHRRLDALLPGHQHLKKRIADVHDHHTILGEDLLTGLRAVAEQLRPICHQLFDLSDAERVHFELVEGVPWNAFNDYQGSLASRIKVSNGAGRNLGALPILVAHEAYGGHHLERCLKEQNLVTGEGYLEHSIAMVGTPQALISEGIGELALDIVLGPGWGEWTSATLAAHHISMDGALIEQLLEQYRQLFRVRQDVMLLIHDQHTSRDDAIAYVERWLLYPRERACQVVDFVLSPLWRTYMVTYIEGQRLVDAWLRRSPNPIDAFHQLLRQPLLPHHLAAPHHHKDHHA